MDTKLKRFSYSITAKVICFLLACGCAFSCIFGVSRLFFNFQEDPYKYCDVFSGKGEIIANTYSFSNLAEDSLAQVMRKSLLFKDGSLESFKTSFKKMIENAYNQRLNQLLDYNSYQNYESLSYVSVDTVCVDGYFIWGENGTPVYFSNSSTSPLKVPEGADRLYYDGDYTIYSVTIDKKALHDKIIDSLYEAFKPEYTANEKALERIHNLQYVIINDTDKTFYGNVPALNAKSSEKELSNYFSDFKWNIYSSSKGAQELNNILFDDDEIEWSLDSNSLLNQEGLLEVSKNSVEYFGLMDFSNRSFPDDEYRLYVAFDETLKSGQDDFSNISANIEDATKNVVVSSVLIVAGFLGTVAALIYLVVTAGRKEKGGEVKIIFVDKVFTLFHAACCFAFIFICFMADWGIAESYIYNNNGRFSVTLVSIACSIVAVVAFAAFTEWIMSFARNVKNKTFLRHTLLGRLFFQFDASFNSEQKRNNKRFVLFAVVVGIYVLLLCVFSLMTTEYDACILPLLLLVAVGAVFVLVTTFYIKKIIESLYSDDKKTTIDSRLFPLWLKPLAKTVENMQNNTNEAIESAIKDQKMKTQLITNVSHDLKTPLTAVINYADLLSRCEIENDQAREYVAIISEKSARLKKLIEDLTEAAKASSGNIQANIVSLNLNEIAVQIAGENEDDLKNKNLELILKVPENPVIVAADSRLTYRVLENLMSNVRKYAMPNSRVYLGVDENKSVYVSNISAKALNISPDELKARFVRGDESRTTEGSGLGLAIADDLCKIQNASLDISIDGDLFKTTVRFETE